MLTVAQVGRYAAMATTLAAMAAAMQLYNSFYVRNVELSLQYQALRESAVCTNASERMASSDVNGCAAAERARSQFSPSTLALLQTLQEMSLCGEGGTRCANLVSGLAGMSISLLALFGLLVLSGMWLLIQKYKIDSFTGKHCPLDTHNYPSSVPFYCNKLD